MMLALSFTNYLTLRKYTSDKTKLLSTNVDTEVMIFTSLNYPLDILS